ncbi:GSH-induced LITAF domain protein-like protein [Drosera capensis]
MNRGRFRPTPSSATQKASPFSRPFTGTLLLRLVAFTAVILAQHRQHWVTRSKISLAAVVGCMMPMMLGVCCGEKVADFEKPGPCLVMDPPNWEQRSFAVPD